jgi:hypothetical protein
LSDAAGNLPRVFHEDAHCIAGTFRNLAIAIWHDDTQPQTVRILAQMLQRLSSQFAAGVGLMQVIGEHHPNLRSESRAELNRMLKAGTPYIRASSLVFEGQGFRAATIRGIAAGLVMLTRVPYPHKVFADLKTAIDFQVTHLPSSFRITAPDLAQALTTLRTRHRDRPLQPSA